MAKYKLDTVDWLIMAVALADIILAVLLILIPPHIVKEEQEERNKKDDEEHAREIGGTGNMKVTLLWDFFADIDIHVIEPDGNEIYYSKKANPSGTAALDVDNTRGGTGSAENVYWTQPAKGEYKVYLNYYGPSTSTNQSQSGECRVLVFTKDQQPRSYSVQMSQKGQEEYITRIIVD